MGQKWKWRFLGAVGLVMLSLLMLVPTFVDTGVDPKEGETVEQPLPEWFTKIFSNKLILGLDLQGGMHLQYKVDIEEALKRRSVRLCDSIEALLKKEKSITATAEGGLGTTIDEVTEITVTFASADDASKMDEDFIEQQLGGYEVASVDGPIVKLVMSATAIKDFRDGAIESAIDTIERRINSFGVAESSISRRGESELVVQLPGIRESEFGAAKEKLSQTGQLRFQIVDRDGQAEFFKKVAARAPKADNWPKELAGIDPRNVIVTGGTVRSTSQEILRYMADGQYDKDHLVGFQEYWTDPKDSTLSEINSLTKDQEKALARSKDVTLTSEFHQGYRMYYLFRKAGMSGENVEDASVGFDEFNRSVVHMRFGQVDADKFADMTERHTNELMAIMIDDVVYSAPNIKERIGGGRVQIEMGAVGPTAFKEANALVGVIKSGALSAPLRKLYDSQVGPTLGADSVAAGKLSVGVGFLAVILFMLVYYKAAGLVANLALFLNLLFVFAGLTAFGATLTLPGIAGIVLTVGMAVDANVLIFERIREELRTGVSVRKAIDAGYEKAFTAIFDANITTGLAAIVLYQFGSGPIRGFAVTLGIGIASSMYTALLITRLVFDFKYGRGTEPAKMSI